MIKEEGFDEIKITKRRQRYNYKYKLAILKEFDSFDKDAMTYAKLKNIPYRTLKRWINERERIMEINKDQINNKKIVSGENTEIPSEIEKEIVRWILDVRSFGIPINRNIITARIK